ncbi:MAG TPA: aromatic ring-hydroxylating dioxygenase subunit alpha [Burkholderiaceae bacterium]|nr:aromatic ring-hydroxylating dioxygenase subunit alpha [Burkholderiaceae bacterium]
MKPERAFAADPAWLKAQPAQTALALPAHCYVDPAFHPFERDTVFAHSWQLVARAEQVARPGDHVVAEIGGVPLVIVRGDDDLLRALHNVCRHRAGPVATCDGTSARSLTCRYHGWTYALDGTLRGAPEMGRAPEFDVASIRLPQAQVTQWRGLVFAALATAPPFDALVADIDVRLPASLPLAFAHRASYDIACDWKVYVDNFLEGYHLPQVHPELNALLDYRSYTTELAAWFVLQSSPLERGNALYGAGDALYYWLYPNTMLNVLPGRLQTNRVLPLGTGRCRVEFDFFYAATDRTDRAGDSQFSDLVQQEDIAICEAVQRGLGSGSYVAGRLNPTRELGVWHFHELLRTSYRAAMPS